MQNQNNFSKPFSEETSRLIDDEARKIIEGQYVRAQQLLKDKRKELDALAKLLLEKEVLFKDDLEALIGKRPYDKPELGSSENPTPNVDGDFTVSINTDVI
jgi:cell division protease FtsH